MTFSRLGWHAVLCLFLQSNLALAGPAPARINTLSATAVSPSSIRLAWEYERTGYAFHLQRSTDRGAVWTKLSVTPQLVGNQFTYTDSNLPSGRRFTYRILAVRQSDSVVSPYKWSDLDVATDFPAAPAELSAQVHPYTHVALRWADRSTNENQFIVQRREPSGDFVAIATVPEGVTSYQDEGAQAGVAYSYRIVARNSRGDSAASPSADAKIPAAPVPLAPSSVLAEPTLASRGSSSVRVTWLANQAALPEKLVRRGENGFFVYRREIPAGPDGELPAPYGAFDVVENLTGYTKLNASAVSDLRYQDETAQFGKSYAYVVVAVAPGVQSVPSKMAAHTIVAPLYLSRSVICERIEADPSDRMGGLLVSVTDPEFAQGANGQDAADDYDALQAAATAFSERTEGTTVIAPKYSDKILLYPQGTYQIQRVRVRPAAGVNVSQIPVPVARGVPITYFGSRNFRVLGCGARVEIFGAFQIENSNHTLEAITPFNFQGVRNGSIEGIEIAGGSRSMRRTSNHENPTRGVRTSNTRNFHIADIDAHHTPMDGIYIGAGQADGTVYPACRNIRVHHVNSHHNTRLALMVAQVRGLYVSDATLNDSGRNGDGGLPNPRFPGLEPMAGMDIEPNFLTIPHVDGGTSLPAVDIATGDVVIENTVMENNQGRTFLAGQKGDESVIRTENVSIRFSRLVAGDDFPAGHTNIGLSVKNGVVEYSTLDTKRGNLQLSGNTGTATAIKPMNAHTSTALLNSQVRCGGVITAGWGRHTLTIANNQIAGTHPDNFFNSGFNPDRYYFIEIFGNPLAVFRNNSVYVPKGIYRKAQPALRLSARAAIGNRYSTNLEGEAFFWNSYGRSTAPSSQAEVSGETTSSAAFRPLANYGAAVEKAGALRCLWSAEQANGVTLPQEWLCRPL